MSRELSLYEAMGGTYRSVAGILYPNIGMDDVDTKSDMASVVTTADIGKYGHLWISYMGEYMISVNLRDRQIRSLMHTVDM